jgi:ribosomal protein L24
MFETGPVKRVINRSDVVLKGLEVNLKHIKHACETQESIRQQDRGKAISVENVSLTAQKSGEG